MRQPGVKAARRPSVEAARLSGSEAGRQEGRKAGRQAGREPTSRLASQVRDLLGSQRSKGDPRPKRVSSTQLRSTPLRLPAHCLRAAPRLPHRHAVLARSPQRIGRGSSTISRRIMRCAEAFVLQRCCPPHASVLLGACRPKASSSLPEPR